MNAMVSKGLMSVILAGLAVAALAAPSGQPSVSVPITQLKFSPTGVSDGVHGELYAAAAYGDFSRGAHGTFVKMPAGFVSKVHTHTEDYYAVVISGVMVSGVPGSADVQLPAGSYWFQKGGEPHISKCVSPVDCIFFVSQAGKYDYIEVPQAK